MRVRVSRWGRERDREKGCVLKLTLLNKAVQIGNAHTHIYGVKKLSYLCSFIL